MAELINVKIEVDVSGIQDRFVDLCQDEQFKLQAHRTLAKDCDPYVPFLTGTLSQTLEITPEYVQYNVPYAHYQYHGVGFHHTLDHHPLATALWDEAMLQNRRDVFQEEIRALLVRRYKELYG